MSAIRKDEAVRKERRELIINHFNEVKNIRNFCHQWLPSRIYAAGINKLFSDDTNEAKVTHALKNSCCFGESTCVFTEYQQMKNLE